MKWASTQFLAVTAAILSYLVTNAAFAAERSDHSEPRTVEQAYQQLLSTKVFALGGVGFAGTISEGEKAFQLVAASTNGLSLFKAAIKHGTPEAQMYGLLGIRKLSRENVDVYVKSLQSANPTITTMSGCLMAEERASNVVARIVTGKYDRRISNPQIR